MAQVRRSQSNQYNYMGPSSFSSVSGCSGTVTQSGKIVSYIVLRLIPAEQMLVRTMLEDSDGQTKWFLLRMRTLLRLPFLGEVNFVLKTYFIRMFFRQCGLKCENRSGALISTTGLPASQATCLPPFFARFLDSVSGSIVNAVDSRPQSLSILSSFHLPCSTCGSGQGTTSRAARSLTRGPFSFQAALKLRHFSPAARATLKPVGAASLSSLRLLRSSFSTHTTPPGHQFLFKAWCTVVIHCLVPDTFDRALPARFVSRW